MFNLLPNLRAEGEGGSPGGDPPSSTGSPPADPPADPTSQAPGPSDQSWRDQLPEDVRTLGAVRDAPDLTTLVKSGLEAQATIGRSIRIPSEQASADDRAAFLNRVREAAPELVHMDLDSPEVRAELYGRLGRPAEADGYTAPTIEPPQGVRADLAGVDEFRTIAHEAGLTDEQFGTIVTRISEQRIEAAQQMQAAAEAGLAELAQDWGYAFDANTAAVRQYARATGAPPELLESLDRNAVGAPTLRWLHNMAVAAAEGTGVVDVDGSQDLPMTPKEAQAQVNEMLANKEHPYWNRLDPRHAEAVEEYLRLTRYAMGPEGKRAQSIVPIMGSELDGDEHQQGGIAFSGTV